jgi:predicted NAD/FAD-binding protein
MLPPLRRAWASWNYHRPAEDGEVAAVTYHMNRLQNIRSRHEICVTLNRLDEIAPETIVATIPYSHPVFDRGAIAAQQRHSEISGQLRTSYCGAYWGYGFHEDGVASAQRVCAELGVRW